MLSVLCWHARKHGDRKQPRGRDRTRGKDSGHRQQAHKNACMDSIPALTKDPIGVQWGPTGSPGTQ
eukprot:13107465-Alexandrium_andersonii.AAC.1